MSIRKLRCLVLLILSFYLPSQATTIEVFNGSSIQSAVDLMSGGDTLLVRAGTYNEKILIENLVGNPSDVTLIKADSGVFVSGVGLTPVSREGLISIRNSSFIVVEGFDIFGFATTGGSGATPIGILVEESGQHISIIHNTIHGIANRSQCTDPCAEGAHGLAVFGTTVLGIRHLLIQGNEIHHDTLQASEALVINGNVSRFQVLNNYVHDNNNIAFDFIGYEGECSACTESNDRARNGLVKGNIALRNSSQTNPWYNGDRSAAGFYVDGGKFIVFDGNISAENDFGFEFASEMPGKKTDSILMINNVMYDNFIAGLIMGGYDADPNGPGGGSSDAIFVYNNTFFNQLNATEIEFQYRVTNSVLSNNILFNNDAVVDAFILSGADTSGVHWGLNLWWGPDTSGHAGNLPGPALVADPLFVDALNHNFHIQINSPARNAGIVLDDITNWEDAFWSGAIKTQGRMDIHGDQRIQELSIDLGADEYNTSANGRNYFVSVIGADNNPGNFIFPFRTVQKGLNTTQAGDTLFVRHGTYFEKLTWTNSGNVNQWVTATNYPGEYPLIDGGSRTELSMLEIRDKNYVAVQGLLFQNNFIQGAKGIYLVGEGEHIHIGQCHLRNMGWSMDPNQDPASVSPTGQAHGILVNGRTTLGLKNITISNCLIHDIITGNSEALTLAGNVSEFEIVHDTVHHTRNIGIDISGHFPWAVDASVPDSLNQSRNGVVKNCVVYDNQRFSNVDAPAGIYADGPKNVLIIGNVSYKNGNGISIGCETPGKIASNITVANNVIYNNVNNGITFGANNGLIENCQLKNNTFFQNGNIGPFRSEVFLQNSNNSKVIQNILIPRSSSHYAVGMFGFSSTNLIVDNNLAYRYNGSTADLYVVDDPPQYNPTNNMSADPVFADTSLASPNFTILSTSPAIDQGFLTYGAVSTLDFNGQDRVVNGFLDHGAIEATEGNCPSTLTIDNSFLLSGKFTALSTLTFNTGTTPIISSIKAYAPNVNLSHVDIQGEFVVEQAGCTN